jgi:acyl-CoA thioesterase I
VLKAYKENVTKMVDAAQAAGIRVVLCTPTVIQEDPNTEGNQRLVMYVAAMKEIAEAKKCLVADLHEAFLQAIAKKPADAKGNAFTSDGVHMTPAGDWIMAEGILRALGVPQPKIDATK